MHAFRIMTLLACLAVLPGPAVAGWGGQVGGWLTNLPLLDIVGNRILENRIAYIRTARGYPPETRARVHPDLGARANVRNRPDTGKGSRIIARLNPGDEVAVIAGVKGAPWLRVRLGPHKQGFIHRKLVTLKTGPVD